MVVEEKQNLLLATFLLAGLMFSACQNESAISSWPPFAGGAVQSFVDRREDIDVLRNLMEETPYTMASTPGDDKVYGYREVNGEMISEIPEDSELWAELMGRSSIDSIIRSDDTYVFSTVHGELSDNRLDLILYIFSDDLPAKECVGGFSNVPCGLCDVSHQEEWTIRYLWYSGQYVGDFIREEMERFEEHKEAVFDGQNDAAAGSLDDYGRAIKKLNANNKECVRKGLDEMGYDNPEDYF